jgi:hypothetical protein
MNEKHRQTIDIRIKKEKEKFLEILGQNPIFNIAFKRSGVSKATFHRWKNEDKEFAQKVEETKTEGVRLVNDMAKSTIISHIKDKDLGAAKFWLIHNDEDFKNKIRGEELKPQNIADENNLKILYKEKPITMHEIFPSQEPMQWPKVIRDAYAKIWSEKYSRVIIKAPRGGGKSKLLGTIGFDLWYLRNRKVVNMGGSAVQAQIVYRYFTDYCAIHSSVAMQIEGKPNASKTTSVGGHYFSSVAASPKQIRGPHPDVLISDETCESDDELIHAALPMIDTSDNPLVIMASTFHKIFGIFQETWDNADERGYLRIEWDVFDIVKTFSPDFWKRPDIAEISGIGQLMKHARGRTGDPQGWIPIENVIQAWKEKPTEDWFEIEYLGSRPSSAGLVLKPEDIDRAVFDSELQNDFKYIQGSTVIIGIDWGFSSMTAVTEFMRHRDDAVIMLDNKNYSQTPSEKIIEDVVAKVKARGIRFVYADSAGKFENIALQNALNKSNTPCKVIEVVFGTEKEAMLGNLRAHFEQGKIKIPKKFKEAYWQYKRYRYQDGTDKPVKKDDHIPDSTMCALQHFQLGKLSRPFPILTKSSKGDDDKPITAGILNKKF